MTIDGVDPIDTRMSIWMSKFKMYGYGRFIGHLISLAKRFVRNFQLRVLKNSD